MTPELKEAQKVAIAAHSESRQTYRLAFRKWFHSLDLLDDKRFWSLLNHYRLEVILGIVRGVRVKDIADAAHEFFRKSVTHDGDWSYEEAAAFAVTYRAKMVATNDPLYDTITDRGDDAYSDLLDSLPLVGPEIYQRSLEGDFSRNATFEKAVRESLSRTVADTLIDAEEGDLKHHIAAVQQFVLHGENYNATSLEEKAEQFFGCYILTSA